MQSQIKQFLNNYFPNVNQSRMFDLDFMNEEELFEWLHQRLLIFIITKDVQIGAKALYHWCQKGFESGIPMVNQILIVIAVLQLRINPKMVDEITQLIQDKEDKQKLIDQLSQAQQKQVNLEVSNSPKILKSKLEQKESGLFGNILTALRCWDKKQK
ncbi:unnamed protein product (macronuclear) [Paramecium tetraurelia]|uniref:Uncharacterized protein n=1 Tax=Paramecium tetraurelia TaxID=5888 RepID=A0D958_PARTE|nr:uncharacterized protein GSPATT00014521001 [Paramecium tetraurelia]CAK79575.1 unnamed protein product [Paramecium tetraurelia]|eukprot:XP_001446972.1 hypothetical protein (macronuclear) [Paramecium tetraurelia strain d4-2]